MKLAADAGMDFPSATDGTLGALGDYTERQKLLDIRREVKKDLREQSRSEMLRDAICEAIGHLEPIKINKDVKLPREPLERELVLGLGDFHYGADFVLKGLYGEDLNVYNSKVFDRRMAELITHVVEICNTHHPDRITVMLVGDLLDGMLRQSQLMRLEYGVVDSAMYLCEYLSQWLSELNFETSTPIRVYGVRGNHGEIRPLGSKAGQFPEENLERMVMFYLHERFLMSDGAIEIEDKDMPMTRMVEVCGHSIMLLHGQGDDIEKIARDHQTMYDWHIDMFMCGHLHKSQTFTAGAGPRGNVVIERVPSICGTDPYAHSKGYTSPPGATAILVEDGCLRKCVYPITLK